MRPWAVTCSNVIGVDPTSDPTRPAAARSRDVRCVDPKFLTSANASTHTSADPLVRFHTEEVTGSNPVSPTSICPGQDRILRRF